MLLFSEYLRELLEAKKMTVSALARLTGVERTTLSKALTGQRCRAGTRQTVHLDCPHGCCRGGRSGRPFAGSGIHTGNVKKI